jgi:hypothetical protein
MFAVTCTINQAVNGHCKQSNTDNLPFHRPQTFSSTSNSNPLSSAYQPSAIALIQPNTDIS